MRKITALVKLEFLALGNDDARVLTGDIIKHINRFIDLHGLRSEPELIADPATFQVIDDEQRQNSDLN